MVQKSDMMKLSILNLKMFPQDMQFQNAMSGLLSKAILFFSMLDHLLVGHIMPLSTQSVKKLSTRICILNNRQSELIDLE